MTLSHYLVDLNILSLLPVSYGIPRVALCGVKDLQVAAISQWEETCLPFAIGSELDGDFRSGHSLDAAVSGCGARPENSAAPHALSQSAVRTVTCSVRQ
eukprot:6215997-Amphidinium_carterae.1